jgi:hypothetical protein
MGQLTRNNDGVISNNMTELEAPVALITSGSAMENKSIDDGTVQTLRSLLERNTLINTIQLSATSSYSTSLPTEYGLTVYESYVQGTIPQGILGSFAFPKAIFDTNPIVADKANNFTYMKADVVITLKVNASPFTSGAINIAYTPMYNELRDIFKYSNITLQGMTSYPNATLYLDQSDSLEMKVPFISPYDTFFLHEPNFEFGQVLISQLTPLRNGDGTKIDVNVFARFENVSVSVPTDKVIQTSIEFPLVRLDRAIDALDSSNVDKREAKTRVDRIIAKLDLSAQSGSEPETQRKGLVEKVAGTVGDMGEVLSTIPGISAFAKPVSWIARTVQGVASVFGWSKPVTTDGVSIVARVPGYNMVNSEGCDTNQSLGLTHDQGILPHGALFENVDEMALSYVLGRQNCVSSGTWSADDNSGDLISAIRIRPKLISDSTPTQLGTFDYTCNLFQKWRGGINLSLTLVKTKFHAGRLALVYCPDGPPPNNLGTLLSTNYNIIVDLNEISTDDGTNAQISMNVPYILNRPYLDNNITSNPAIGVYVLNPLKQPSGCADSIDLLLWKCAGEDFEVSIPGGQFQIAPWDNLTSRYTHNEVNSLNLEAQAGFNEIQNNVYQIMPGQTTKGRLEQAVCAIGEKVDSLRSLTKRFGKIAMKESLITSYPSSDPAVLSPREAVLMLYRFFYGGVRYKFPVNEIETINVNYATTLSTLKFAKYLPNSIYSNPVEVAGNINNLAEVEVPFFSSTRLRTVGVKEIQDSPQVLTLGVRARLVRGDPRKTFLISTATTPPTVFTNNTYACFYFTASQYQALLTAGGVIKNLTGDTFYPDVIYDNAYWQWVAVPPPTGAENLTFMSMPTNPAHAYEANSDTAGATFLVAPPCMSRTYLHAVQHI